MLSDRTVSTESFLSWTSFKKIPWRTFFFWLTERIQPAKSFLKRTGHWCRRIRPLHFCSRWWVKKVLTEQTKAGNSGNLRHYSHMQKTTTDAASPPSQENSTLVCARRLQAMEAGLGRALKCKGGKQPKIGSQSEGSRSGKHPLLKRGLGGVSPLPKFKKKNKFKRRRRGSRGKEFTPLTARAEHLSSSPPPYRHRPVEGRVLRLTAMHRPSLQLLAPQPVCNRLSPASSTVHCLLNQVPGFRKVSGKGKQIPLFLAGAFPVMRTNRREASCPFVCTFGFWRNYSLPSNQIQVRLGLASTSGFPHFRITSLKFVNRMGFFGRLSFNQFKHNRFTVLQFLIADLLVFFLLSIAVKADNLLSLV